MRYDCLIIDDEKPLADSTAEYFNLFGLSAKALYSAEECEAFLRENTAELLLLDINLEGESGFELCKRLRKTVGCPILFISARTSDDDKIVALSIGGDDYIQKPYSLSVLLAKVKAVLKRYGSGGSHMCGDGRLAVDLDKCVVTVAGEPVRLKAMEYKLLAYLAANAGRVVGKDELFDKVWGDTVTGDGTLNVHIRRLREAIEPDPNRPIYIKTVWGRGYLFEVKQ